MRYLVIIALTVLCINGPIPVVYADQVLGIRESTMKQLQKIQAALDTEQHEHAKQLITKLKGAKLRDYERAQVLNIEGYLFFEENNTLAALSNFEQVLAIKSIPLGLKQTVLRSLAQIYLIEEKYQKALETVEHIIANAKTTVAGNYVMRAQTLYHLNRFEESLADIERALRMDDSQGLTPRENWLLIKNAILFELERYPEMINVVKRLLEHHPKDRYLTSLATLYSQQGMSEAQLALLEPLYEDGRLEKQEHLINLAHLYLSLQTPYKSAKLISDGIANGTLEKTYRHLELSGKAYQLAEDRTRAVAAYEAAAALAKTGDIYINIAHLHIADLNWEAADQALKKAFEKGQLSKEADAYLLLGMVRFYLKNYDGAKQSFLSASSYPAIEEHAQQWLSYLRSEVGKLTMLEEKRLSRR